MLSATSDLAVRLVSRAGRVLLLVAVLTVGAAGCTPRGSDSDKSPANAGSASAEGSSAPLPDSAYDLQPDLPKWIDPETGYDTTREWKLEGGVWPVALFMSPSQSPQLLVGERDGTFAEALEPFGITPSVEKIDLPPRAFHALQRSKWPFVYVPLAVFTDYVRTQQNQGGAGGLQYVALAGSTAGGGYTLVARDPAIKTVADLAGKTVAQVNSNPVPGTLLESAARQAGLTIGEGPDQIHFARGPGGEQLNEYMDGKYDAVISLNILKGQLLSQGSHAVTDFSDVDYTPNYTVLAVERSVLEERPDVVKAFLKAHFEADKVAERQWDTGLKKLLFESWNAYFETQTAPSAKQRIVPDQAAFDVMLGDMYPEQRIDPKLLADCFAFATRNELWGWKGTVDTSRLAALGLYDEVLKDNGEKPQSSASKQ